MIWIELVIVLAAILIGARIGGVGLGLMGGVGLAVLTFGFGLQPTAPPIDVMLIIIAVISAASVMQSAGGLDFMVKVATKILRKNPDRITFLGPAVTYAFTFVAGTGHIAYAILPVIAEVARETGIRPERPLSIAVIASQQAITSSPVSAATAVMIVLLSPMGITLLDILSVSIPATLIGVFVGAFVANKMGKDLKDDKEYLKRVAEGEFANDKKVSESSVVSPAAKLSVLLFIIGVVFIVIFGSSKSLLPSWEVEGVTTQLSMTVLIQIVMLSIAAITLLACKIKGSVVGHSSVFIAGMQAVIAIFGIAWMGDTFIQSNMPVIKESLMVYTSAHPWTFAFALFVMSILLYSQAATLRAILPLGIALGIPSGAIIAMFPAVNGYFFIPNYPTVVAAISFDRTGTTRIGKYLLNHSFMIPGLVSTFVAVSVGFLLSSIFI